MVFPGQYQWYAKGIHWYKSAMPSSGSEADDKFKNIGFFASRISSQAKMIHTPMIVKCKMWKKIQFCFISSTKRFQVL